eukprot:7632699-Alexandrium_andersonii.AAC.1
MPNYLVPVWDLREVAGGEACGSLRHHLQPVLGTVAVRPRALDAGQTPGPLLPPFVRDSAQMSLRGAPCGRPLGRPPFCFRG